MLELARKWVAPFALACCVGACLSHHDRSRRVTDLPHEGYRLFEVGKGGAKRFMLKTPAGTIDVAGATFVVGYLPPDAAKIASRQPIRLAGLSPELLGIASDASMDLVAADDGAPLRLAQGAPVSAGLSPGLYVQVIDGSINLSNSGGSQNFSAGQFGYTASFTKPPVVVPNNPGLKFPPPPAFSSTSTNSSSTSPGKSNTVDCEVR